MTISIVLTVINALVFVLLSFGGRTDDLYYILDKGATYAPIIFDGGEYYRLFTSMFLHFDFDHLMSNMFSLLIFGKYVEPLVGKLRFLIIYILSGLGGNIISCGIEYLRNDNAVSAGASGAVFGLMGALLCLVILNRGRIGTITKQGMYFMVGMSLYTGFTSSGVDNVAHIGGLVCGMWVTAILCWNLYGKRRTDSYY